MERRQNGDYGDRLVRVETQIGRLVSDAESEKETRRRTAQRIEDRFQKIEERLAKIEKSIWTAAGISTGAMAVIVFLINLMVKHL